MPEEVWSTPDNRHSSGDFRFRPDFVRSSPQEQTFLVVPPKDRLRIPTVDPTRTLRALRLYRRFFGSYDESSENRMNVTAVTSFGQLRHYA